MMDVETSDPLQSDCNNRNVLQVFAEEGLIGGLEMMVEKSDADEIYDPGSDEEDINISDEEITEILPPPAHDTLLLECTTEDDAPITPHCNTDDTKTLHSSQSTWKDGDCQPTVFSFTKMPGPRIDYSNLSTALDYFKLFISEDLVQRICEETNRYADCYMEKFSLPPKSRFHRWRCTTSKDIWAFLGLITAMGLIKISDIDDYWSEDELFSMPFFASTMSKDSFLLILTFLHLNDNRYYTGRGNQGFDALFKVRPFIDTLKDKFLTVFYPGQNLALGESMMARRVDEDLEKTIHRNSGSKGIRVFEVCDCNTGYCSNFEIYTGTEAEIVKEHKENKHDIALGLIEQFLDVGHNVYIDKFFTSPGLFQNLAARRTNACGTLNFRNRDDLPSEMKPRRGKKHSNVVMNNNNMNIIKYYDSVELMEVNILSTLHTASRKAIGRVNSVTGQCAHKPEAVIDHRKFMSTVGRSDQIIHQYSFRRRSLKGWKKVFFHFLTLAELNAYIVYKCAMRAVGQQPMDHKLFRKELAKQLAAVTPKPQPAPMTRHIGVGDSSINHLSPRPKPQPALMPRRIGVGDSSIHRLSARHFPSKVQQNYKKRREDDVHDDSSPARTRSLRRQCVVCSGTGKRRESTFLCESCNVALCITPCFGFYHMHKDFKTAKSQYDKGKKYEEPN